MSKVTAFFMLASNVEVEVSREVSVEVAELVEELEAVEECVTVEWWWWRS